MNPNPRTYPLKPFPYGTCVLILFTASGCSNITRQLTPVATVPQKGDDMYIGMTMDFTVDTAENIWICDQGTNSVHRFAPDFSYVTSIGSLPGQGPGEFMGPAFISVTDAELMVIDMANRVQILDREGRYKATIQKDSHGFGLAAVGDTLIIADIDMGGGTTMTACDHTGNVLTKFGALYTGTEACTSLLNLGRIHISHDHIYFIYMYYPAMLVYDREFRPVSTVTFDHHRYEKMSRNNSRFNEIRKDPAGINECSLLFTASDVNRAGIFLVTRGKDIRIDRFDHAGNFLNAYTFPACEFAIRAMQVRERPGRGLRFYLLGAEITNGIHVVKVFDYKNHT